MYNAGEISQAERAIRSAEVSFKKAVAMNSEEGQAYANMAIFKLNTNQFDESLEYWAETLKRVDDQDMKDYITEKIRFTKYGKFSSHRDSMYNNGQGNISAALEAAIEQEKLYRSPEVLFDIATLQV